jgi:hypothetical protein
VGLKKRDRNETYRLDRECEGCVQSLVVRHYRSRLARIR